MLRPPPRVFQHQDLIASEGHGPVPDGISQLVQNNLNIFRIGPRGADITFYTRARGKFRDDNPARNFYNVPYEIIKYLSFEENGYINRYGNIDLRQVRDKFDRIEQVHIDDDDRHLITREAINRHHNDGLRVNNHEAINVFCEGEINRLLNNHNPQPVFFPSLSAAAVNGIYESLIINANDIRDLPTYMIIYILYRLSHHRDKSVSVGYTINVNYASPSIVNMFANVDQFIRNRNGRPITIRSDFITFETLHEIYLGYISVFYDAFPGNIQINHHNLPTWNGSDDSGTRMILALNINGSPGAPVNANFITFKMRFFKSRSQTWGGTWTPQVEDILTQSVGNSVISVRNRHDNKCLIYCIVMGLMLKFKEGAGKVFGVGSMMVEDYEIFTRGSYMFLNDADEVSDLIRRLSATLIANNYSEGEISDLCKYVDDIDKDVGSLYSIDEFRAKFKDIEEKLIPNKYCGIDVYGIDYNTSPHIYPLYMSHNRDRVLSLLCVTPLNSRTSHFCLITNMEKLLRRSGGKQFFACARCGQCFYHKRLLADHHCPAIHDLFGVDGEGGYHYSCKNVDPKIDIICGACPKCRLCFIDDFRYQYHMEHCFMEGKTGFRHVQLIDYDPKKHPSLDGVSVEREEELKKISDRKILYADFECSIDPENGLHSFMSYGVYNWKDKKYKTGYDIAEFMDYLVDLLFSSTENSLYVYFHNAMNYDANFILRYVLRTKKCENWGIKVIMKSMNRLQKLSFFITHDDKKKTLTIGDTFMFLTLSLENIVGSIRTEDLATNVSLFPNFFEQFKIHYPGVMITEIDHILRKNIFPYKYFTDSGKLNTEIEEFLSLFEPREENLKYFSERVKLDDLRSQYEDTSHVIEVFGCKSARDYHDLYLLCDVMQLADVFDRSMNILWESHNIHLTNYIGMPSASWGAFLRHDPKMSIPLYEDTFFAEFFMGMVRGGITSAVVRHAFADDQHSIIYLDVNGLYPYVMQKYDFPCGKFEFKPLNWLGTDICKMNLIRCFDRLEREHKGMCFCVDMIIDDDVKKMTDMYPFAPEHRLIYDEYFDEEHEKMTPFLQRWSEANDNAKMNGFKGLVCTLYNKEKYNVHWRLLKFYLEHGVKISRVHFAILFDEGNYLAGYIRKNIEIRNTRKDVLGKTLYKLLGNSIYGKTFESPFKRNTYEIIKDEIKLSGLIEEGNIASITPIDDVGWIVKLNGEDIILDKPTYIGACVCEFAKLHMYTLLYDKLMSIFPMRDGEFGCQLIYTDTDSFIVKVRHPPEITHNDPKLLFEYIKSKDPDLIGGIGGQVKSETGEDDTIKEIVALRAKAYAYETFKGEISKHAKGTTMDAQEAQLDMDIYRRTIETLVTYNTHNMQFVREVFKINTIDLLKKSLSVNDGKRFICDDGIHTHAFGYNFETE